MRAFDTAVLVVALIVVVVASVITRYRPPMACLIAHQNDKPKWIDSGFSFGSGGLLFAYHIGVVEFLMQMGVSPDVPLAGASCGVIAALSLRLSLSPETMKKTFWGLLDHIRENGPQGSVAYLREQLESILPDDAHEICNRGSNFYIELSSSVSLRPFLVNRFESRERLIDVVCVSCTIPFVTGVALWAFDGFFLNRCDSRIAPMIPVDCFSYPWQGMAEIFPSPEIRHFPMLPRDFQSAAMIPDAIERYHALMRKGFGDASRTLLYLKPSLTE